MADHEPPASENNPATGKTGRTKLFAAGAAGAALSLAAVVGVAFTGPSSSANATGADTPTASTESSGTPARRARHGIGGTVTAVSGTTLTVTTDRPHQDPRSFTVTTSDSTRFSELEPGELTDLGTGDTVVAIGDASDGTVSATRIAQTPGDALQKRQDAKRQQDGGANQNRRGFRDRPDRVFGTIAAVDGSTLTLQTPSGENITVTTTDATKVTLHKTVSLGDVEVGDHVRARGTVDGTTVAASAVMTGTPPRPGGPHGDPNAERPRTGPPTTS